LNLNLRKLGSGLYERQYIEGLSIDRVSKQGLGGLPQNTTISLSEVLDGFVCKVLLPPEVWEG
jgi:hypothetical protein